MLKIPSATVRWFSQTDTSIYRGFLPWFSHDFPWFFPWFSMFFFCLMTGYFCDLAGSRRSRRSSTRLPRASTTCSKLWEISRCLAWNGPWWDDDVGWMKLEWNWDETDVDELLGSFYWLPSLGDFEVTTLCLRWPQQPTIQFTPRCIANTRNKNMNHSEIRQIVAYPCSYPDQPLLVMGSEAILCRWSPFVFCESTRRRMARERRGAGSSLVSMETQY